MCLKLFYTCPVSILGSHVAFLTTDDTRHVRKKMLHDVFGRVSGTTLGWTVLWYFVDLACSVRNSLEDTEKGAGQESGTSCVQREVPGPEPGEGRERVMVGRR